MGGCIRNVGMTRVFNRSPEGLQFLWMDIEVISYAGREFRKRGTYGTISSRRPERNRTGTSVIWGMMLSLGQIWWHRRVRYRAGGITLQIVNYHC